MPGNTERERPACPASPPSFERPAEVDANLIVEAAHGSSDACANLAKADLALWNKTRNLEALFRSEVWGRLSAAGDVAEGVQILAAVFRQRVAFEHKRGMHDVAHWYDAQLALRLHASAATKLIKGQVSAKASCLDRQIAAAAMGDAAALRSLFDDTMAVLDTNKCDPNEALAAGDIYSALGSVLGDRPSIHRRVMLFGRRGANALAAGHPAHAADMFAEGIILVRVLADLGEEPMAENLGRLTASMSNLGVREAIERCPEILKHVHAHGSC